MADANNPIDCVKVEPVGGTLKEAEKEALKKYLDSCKCSSRIRLSELIKTASENLRRKYNGTTKTSAANCGIKNMARIELRMPCHQNVLKSLDSKT